MEPIATIIVTASVILQQNNKILMVQEGKKQSENLWNFPGGRFEKHESVFDCATRECLEETGYTVQLTALLGMYKYISYGKWDMIRYVFFANEISKQDDFWHHEIKAHRWVSLAEIDAFADDELLAPNSVRTIVQDIRSGKTFPIEAVKWC
jgi:ADP-ribose pyrophosphatase YjhB (NUDIX family)